MEFTIENGKLYMLQTRNGKRTAAAALKIAVDLVDEGMIDEEEAVLRVEPKQLDALLHPAVRRRGPEEGRQVIGKGLAASPGAACGQVVFTAEDAKEWRRERARRSFWSVWRPPPRTSRAWQVAQGILTVRGGMTSHAAVVARGMGTCCVSGCGEIIVDYEQEAVHPGRQDLSTRATGSPSTAPPATSTARPSPPSTLPSPATSAASWAGRTQYRKLKVCTNADNPRDAAAGRRLRR